MKRARFLVVLLLAVVFTLALNAATPTNCVFAGSSQAWKKAFLLAKESTPRRRETFSRVSTEGTVCAFSTPERQTRRRPHRISMSPWDKFFALRTARTRSPMNMCGIIAGPRRAVSKNAPRDRRASQVSVPVPNHRTFERM